MDRLDFLRDGISHINIVNFLIRKERYHSDIVLQIFYRNCVVSDHTMECVAVDMFPYASGAETVVLLGREFSEDVEYAYLDYESSTSAPIKGDVTYSELRIGYWINMA